MPEKPDNVMIRKWMPQLDILCKLRKVFQSDPEAIKSGQFLYSDAFGKSLAAVRAQNFE